MKMVRNKAKVNIYVKMRDLIFIVTMTNERLSTNVFLLSFSYESEFIYPSFSGEL